MATGSRASGHGEEEEEAARHPWGRGCGSRVTAPGEEEEEVVGHGEGEEKVASLATGDEEEKVAPPLTRCQGEEGARRPWGREGARPRGKQSSPIPLNTEGSASVLG